MASQMKRAAVTGGGGFIGKAVVRRLLDRGVDTVVVGRQRYPDLQEMGVSLFTGDIRDGDFLARAFEGCDAVFHAAAKAGIWGRKGEYVSVNIRGTENVIAACREKGVSALVYTSTPSVVFGSDDLEGAGEELPYSNSFLCAYAETKAEAERKVLAADGQGLSATALRPHLVWGPGDTNLIPRLIERAGKGLLSQVGSGLNRVDISYIDNVADAHLLAADSLLGDSAAAGRAYFISQGEPVNLWEWIGQFLELAGAPPVRRVMSFRRARAAGAFLEVLYRLTGVDSEPVMTRFLAEQLAMSHWFSIANARRDLRYVPKVTTEEGMRLTAQWVKENMSL